MNGWVLSKGGILCERERKKEKEKGMRDREMKREKEGVFKRRKIERKLLEEN